MYKIKLIFIILTIAIYDLKADLTLQEVCINQLVENGGFDVLENKTQVFIQAYHNWILPTDEHIQPYKDIFHAYQKELLHRYLLAHKNNLQHMFQKPMEWCDENIDKSLKVTPRISALSKNERCNESMNNKRLPKLLDYTQESALESMFFRFKLSYKTTKDIKKLQRLYFIYVGSIVSKYVEFTYARGPLDYCNNTESPPLYLLSFDENQTLQFNINTMYNQPLVHQSPLNLYALFNIIDVTPVSSKIANECIEQLIERGLFHMEQNKTQAFMHSYEILTVPENENVHSNKEFVFAYQRDLLNKFLEAHKKSLPQMFDAPMKWCLDNIDVFKPRKYSKKSNEERCEESMNNNKLPTFTEYSQETALESMFCKLSLNYTYRRSITEFQKYYLKYVGHIIIEHVENTNASSPVDYCKSLNSLPEKVLNVNQNYKEQWDMNQEENVTLDQLPIVNQDDIFDIVDQNESSSALYEDIEPFID